jgi:hypothetical protein
LLIAAALAVLLGGGQARAGQSLVKRVSWVNLTPETRSFRDTVYAAGRSHVVRRPAGTGGVYPTADGYQVRINVSASYAPDRIGPQSVADFLGSLLHGSELGRVTVNIGTLPETRAVCGPRALACYDAASESIYVPGEDAVGLAVEQLLAHEYGHHVAVNRANPPWSALWFGPKYWASYESICRKSVAGEVYPGDESSRYPLNPGEGWAETYRLLNASRLGGWREVGWSLVDPLFYPNAGALQAAQNDVLQPWTTPTVRTIRGTLRRRGYHHWTVYTSQDGLATVSVTGRVRASFYSSTAGQIVDGESGPSVTVCGDRALQLGVYGTGAFTLTYSLPAEASQPAG